MPRSLHMEIHPESHTSSADAPIPLYQILAEDLKSLGIAHVFGLMSADTAALVATLDGLGVEFHAARHENTAVAMAEGYASGGGALGVALIGRGPATANAVYGASYAKRNASRVLLICGDAPNAHAANELGPDSKAWDAVGGFAAIGVPTFVATSAESAEESLASAIAATHGGKTVALLLPENVLRAKVKTRLDAATLCAASTRQTRSTGLPTSIAVAAAVAAAILARSSRPLIIAGLGAHRSGARDCIERLADKIDGMLATSLKAKDMFRGNPRDIGLVGSFSSGAGRRMIEQADCIVVLGASLNRRTTSYGSALPPDVPIIHVDLLRQNIGRWSRADVAIVGDVRTVVQALFDLLPDRMATTKSLRNSAPAHPAPGSPSPDQFVARNTARTIDPRALALELDRLLPADRNLVYDSGNFLQVIPYLRVLGPQHFKITSDFSSVGMGFGVALGFGQARSGNTTVLIVGDGGLLMTLGELETVAREGLPLIVVVMNDCAYGAELHYLKMERLPVAKALFPDVDFAPIAEAFGFQAATIRSAEDLRRVAPLLRDRAGPVLLDCKITASVEASFLSEKLQHSRSTS
jgi:thiamine pyrophosphate-dependent acetolactate synthase large subunit-like protein